MEQNNTAVQPVKTGKAAVNYGVIFGVIMILEFIIAYALDINPQQNKTIGLINSILNNLILPVLFIALACNYFKKQNGGYIKFGESLKTGVATTVIAAAVFAVFNIVFYLIFPEAQAEILQKVKEAQVATNPNLTAEQLKMTIKVTEMFMKPYIAFPVTIIIYAFLGLIYSLLVGAIVKKEKPGTY
ncbi:DUF4199 domain-containing protein [Flavobacterium rhizosphaerae]|uniref:DUF4199 domain-containing protein n=1 Tax=Flavobacterium rhizosphaerae TaxID=3163298 RepID=A0ABW8YXI8_9FLAO